jgi:plastocyanin
MMRLLSLCLLLALAPGANAATFIVNVGGAKNGFNPQTVTIAVGDTVTFVNKGGDHNVNADNGSFRCARGCDGDGMGGNGSPSTSNWVASITFGNAGNVGYFCETHGMPGAGMYGTVVVQGQTPPPPATQPVPGGSFLLYLSFAAMLALAAAASLRRRRR